MSGSPDGYSLRELAERYGGEVIGDPDVTVSRVGTLENAGPDTITFLANERYARQLQATSAAAVIVGPAAREATTTPRIVCANPYLYFARVSALFNPPRPAEPGIHSTALVHAEARVHPGAEVGPYAIVSRRAQVEDGAVIGAGSYVGEAVSIGRNTRLHPGVAVYAGCTIGARTIIHSGVVIGADGFGIAFDEDHWVKVPQIGRVRVGDDVEVGANTTIDRGAIDDTVVEDGVKLDNQIQIAHNVHIGAHTAIAACTGIAGSVRIGRYCRIGGAVGIAGHVEIGDRVEISGQTAVTRSISRPGAYSGVYPFEPNREWRRNAAQVRHLDELAKRIAALEAAVEQLTRARGSS
jgi:UDP-3-O-[3-hydroxymyristoyl] glucosamine N-acyltransferase